MYILSTHENELKMRVYNHVNNFSIYNQPQKTGGQNLCLKVRIVKPAILRISTEQQN